MKNIIFKTILYLAIFLSFVLIGNNLYDPDFGYRLVNGQKILTEGTSYLLKNDQFTYTMPNVHWIEHSWGFAVLLAILFPFGGYLTLSTFFAILTMISLSLVTKTPKSTNSKKVENNLLLFGKNLGSVTYFPYILAAGILVFLFGVRAQVVSWFMVSVLIFVLFEPTRWNRYKYITPLFFLLWANMHGSVAVGLLFLVITLVVESEVLQKFVIKSKLLTKYFIILLGKTNLQRKDSNVYRNASSVLLVILSFLATLITPHKFDLWTRIIATSTDNSARWSIYEWMPGIFLVNPIILTFAAISIYLIWKYRKKIRLNHLVLYFVTLVMAMASRRHIAIWTLVTTPILISSIHFLYQEVVKIKFAKERIKIVYTIFWVFCFILFISQVYFENLNAKNDEYYPKNAIAFLKNNPSDGEVFSTYNWGGYLIWKYPEKKVFVDGRLPIQDNPEGGKNESTNAFKDYLAITSGEMEYLPEFEKYQIRTVLYPQNGDRKKSFETIVENFIDNLLGIEDDTFDFVDKLKNDGWFVVYEDNVAVVLKNQI